MKNWGFFFFPYLLSGPWQAPMTHLKPWCLTPISTTTEGWWLTLLCLEVGSEKGTRSCQRISAKPMRSTSWGFCDQMSTRHRSCTWHFSSSHVISLPFGISSSGAEMMNQLVVDWQKIWVLTVDSLLRSFFKAEIPNICWFQLLNCQDLLLLYVII